MKHFDPDLEALSKTSFPHVDVVIATRNRPEDVARLIPALREQTHADFQCILVDHSDDPASNAELLFGQRDERFLHIARSGTGKCRALNAALATTMGPLVAFTDDDCIPPPDWLERAIRAYRQLPRQGIVFGNVRAPEAGTEGDGFYVPTITFDETRVLTEPLVRSPGIVGMGANMIVGREVFDHIGFFDEDLGPGATLSSGEECEFAYRALSLGFAVAQDPSFELLHLGARPVVGSEATRVPSSGYFGVGAGYGKHLRGGDLLAALVSLDESREALSAAVKAVAARQAPVQLRRIASFLHGVAAGASRGKRAPTPPAGTSLVSSLSPVPFFQSPPLSRTG
jgi:hypothetical protein